MIFSNDKKKELWRYASKNILPSYEDPSIHPSSPTTHHYQYSSQTQNQLGQNTSSKIPPPPYISVAFGLVVDNLETSVDMSGLPVEYKTDRESGIIIATKDKPNTVITQSSEHIKRGCSFENIAGNMITNDTSLSLENRFLNYKCVYLQNGNVDSTFNSSTLDSEQKPTHQSTFAVTAANMFRNCCGGGIFCDSAYSSIANPNNKQDILRQTSKKDCDNFRSFPAKWLVQSSTNSIRSVTQDFNLLMKQLKHKQISELLRAVKSRLDPPIYTPRNLIFRTNFANSLINFTQCILIKVSENNEEPYVTTCRLFFWPDLRSAFELKRVPICPSGGDRIYACCNPIHWCRIIDTEFAPPPYQRQKTMRLKNTNLEQHSQIQRQAGNIQNTFVYPEELNDSFFNSLQNSLTTYGADNTQADSMIWCQIAYWELSRRIGTFYNAKKPSINIYAEGTVNSFCEGMCLADLIDQKTSINAVEHTRQKIGLGVILNLDADDVWVYNRATAPIFVDSPTLSEGFDRVWKVMPGFCLKAFDNQRAKFLNSKQTGGHQLGPTDWFSMKISFAKGWGHTYRRQDITGCPCWLDVHFNRTR